MKIAYLEFELQLKHEFKISYNSRKTTPVVLVRVEQEGIFGYGEASLPPYLKENTLTVIEFLRVVKMRDIFSFDDLKEVLSEIDSISEGNTAAKCALDIALHDLLGKILKQTSREMYNIKNNLLPYTSFTIGLDEDSVIKQKVLEASSFHILKIKLGTQRDKEIIELIRRITDKPLYVDANQAWDNINYASEMIEWMATQNVLLIEQPVPKNNYDAAAILKEKSPLPIIADEAFQRFVDLEKVKDAYNGVNIKLMKCTGIYEAYKIINKARELNLQVMMGCMTETSCAISAAIQLAPLIDYADLDGNLLISNDPFKSKTVSEGRLISSDLYGIGIECAEDMLFREL